MKISKTAYETKWRGYLNALENFSFINVHGWSNIPLERVEIVVWNKP